ncbi:Kinesin motor domain-containing protein [Caenorhabditis elegans]|uniref:Kinesin motor domain-containing protein n=1 Tax=Caenorhabditis elegans TaxID=6239 RepID=Q17659_CAEEL|nr:Kinesin motor domain-containing protein [Caenorhabditis elegans]CAA90756.1 Kinesin motor domain-containing protein [Caenorhabditis elegans]|eukprot:NP_496435.1 Uncharacterized protein CELE_C05D12.5 [Caenorhabditis elegans]
MFAHPANTSAASDNVSKAKLLKMLNAERKENASKDQLIESLKNQLASGGSQKIMEFYRTSVEDLQTKVMRQETIIMEQSKTIEMLSIERSKSVKVHEDQINEMQEVMDKKVKQLEENYEERLKESGNESTASFDKESRDDSLEDFVEVSINEILETAESKRKLKERINHMETHCMTMLKETMEDNKLYSAQLKDQKKQFEVLQNEKAQWEKKEIQQTMELENLRLRLRDIVSLENLIL